MFLVFQSTKNKILFTLKPNIFFHFCSINLKLQDSKLNCKELMSFTKTMSFNKALSILFNLHPTSLRIQSNCFFSVYFSILTPIFGYCHHTFEQNQISSNGFYEIHLRWVSSINIACFFCGVPEKKIVFYWLSFYRLAWVCACFFIFFPLTVNKNMYAETIESGRTMTDNGTACVWAVSIFVGASNFSANRLIALCLDFSRISCMLMCKQSVFMSCESWSMREKNRYRRSFRTHKKKKQDEKAGEIVSKRADDIVYDVGSIGMNCTFCTSLIFFFLFFGAQLLWAQIEFLRIVFRDFPWRQHTLSFAPAATALRRRAARRKKVLLMLELFRCLFLSWTSHEHTHDLSYKVRKWEKSAAK